VDDSLLEVVLARLDDPDYGPEAVVEALVLAALDSDEALAEALGGDAVVKPRPKPVGTGGKDTPAPKMYLERIQVSGFRGIGPTAEIRLQPGPGLTVVCGRNGSGKSSFAEGLEVLFTGSLKRWERRSRDWSTTWRCLHTGDPAIRAEVLVDGTRGLTVLERRWTADQAIDEPTTTVQAAGKTRATIEDYGWARAVGEFRPFLSHAELEALLDSPMALHRQLNDLLGLEDLDDATERLRNTRTALDRASRAHKDPGRALVEALRVSEDERAVALLALVEARKPDLEAVETMAVASDESDTAAGAILPALAAIAIPTFDEVTEASDALRRAVTAVADAESNTAAGAESAAGLLRVALDHTSAHPGTDCPVCGTTGVIDDDWRARTTKALAAHEQATAQLAQTRRQLADATAWATSLVRPAPPALAQAPAAGINTTALVAVWQRWSTPITDPAELADHLDAAYTDLAASFTGLQAEVAEYRKVRQESWTPLAKAALEWCAAARGAAVAAEQLKWVRKAETWLRDGNNDLRDQRLRPIIDRIKENWAQLRRASNVDLIDLRLVGTAKQAHVDFNLSVDGTDAAGLGVLSQGETNALALSVFLPRATLPASPFGFLVIDDPVQAMDPSKVDGLAQMLARAGKSRQVVVFTHDERLPEAIRRLAISARVLRVSRRISSQVQVDVAKDPTEALLDDARQVVKGETVPAEVAAQVVPGICRTAVETTLNEIARRRLLASGTGHAEVEELIAAAKRLWERLSLAAKGEVVPDPDIQGWARNKLDHQSVDLLFALNRAAHGNTVPGLSISDLPADTRKLVRRLTQAVA
jgi:hypothetical protein